MGARGAQRAARTHHWPGTVAARQVPVEKQLNRRLVKLTKREAALAHPTRQMRQARNIVAEALGGISSVRQVSDKGVGVRRQNAMVQPGFWSGMQRGDRVHGSLLKCCYHPS